MRELVCDVAIVGSGAAGGTLAATLSEFSSLKVIVLERGGHYTRGFFNQHEWDMRVLYADEGLRSTDDGALPVRGGECVGGGTTVNLALCFDPVPSVWQRFADTHGVEGFSLDAQASDYGVSGLSLARALADVRARIGVASPPEDRINENNRRFASGCEALGIATRKFELNMRGCIACGYCAQGCAYDAKQGTMVTYLHDAVDRGVTLIHHAEVTRVEFARQNGTLKATGVSVEVRETAPGSEPNAVEPGRWHIRAKLVVVSAGAIESPTLLLRSEHPDPYDVIGRGLVLHPSLPVVGRFAQEVMGHRGIEGSMFSDHFFASHGFYLECLFGHPVYGAALLPGLGPAHFEWMRAYRKLAGFGVMLVDQSTPDNRVTWSRATHERSIRYRLTEADKARLRFAAQKAVEVMFAAGAEEVLLPSEEPLGPLAAPRFHHVSEARHCAALRFLPHQTVLTSAHCQATLKMGRDPKRSMLSSRGESHGVRNLMVVDASSFPESCGANPMLSIMAMARYQGIRVAREWSRYA